MFRPVPFLLLGGLFFGLEPVISLTEEVRSGELTDEPTCTVDGSCSWCDIRAVFRLRIPIFSPLLIFIWSRLMHVSFWCWKERDWWCTVAQSENCRTSCMASLNTYIFLFEYFFTHYTYTPYLGTNPFASRGIGFYYHRWGERMGLSFASRLSIVPVGSLVQISWIFLILLDDVSYVVSRNGRFIGKKKSGKASSFSRISSYSIYQISLHLPVHACFYLKRSLTCVDSKANLRRF